MCMLDNESAYGRSSIQYGPKYGHCLRSGGAGPKQVSTLGSSIFSGDSFKEKEAAILFTIVGGICIGGWHGF